MYILSLSVGLLQFFFDNETEPVYIALFLFVVAGICLFLLSHSGSNHWDDDAAAEAATNPFTLHHPQRPTRQRLTKEQVQQLLPIYQYDGQSKLSLTSPEVADQVMETTASDTDTLQQPLISTSSENGTTGTAAVRDRNEQKVIDNVALEVCSICLDEHKIHDKIRILPCHHTFHSKCVERWLIERSAVCPLCNENLYIQPKLVHSESHHENATIPVYTTTTIVNGSNIDTSIDTLQLSLMISNVSFFNFNNNNISNASNNMRRRFMEHLAIPATTVARPSITANVTTNNELLNRSTTADVEMSIVARPIVESTTIMETELPAAASAPARISRRSSTATATSTSLLPSNTNNNSLTEPLLRPVVLQESEQEDVEAAIRTVPLTVEDSTVPITSASATSFFIISIDHRKEE
jgi:hypothetical protein